MGNRSRSRGARADGERTRERILEAALPLFAAHGYAGTSIRAVASAAGVNVATLAYHFDDKRGLYLTVVQRLHEALSESFPDTPPAGAPGEVLAWWVEQGWRFVETHREQVRLAARHVLDEGGHPDVVMDRWTEPLVSRAEAILALFRPEWSRVARRLLVLGTMHQLVRLSLENRDQLARVLGIEEADVDREVVAFLAASLRAQLGLPD